MPRRDRRARARRRARSRRAASSSRLALSADREAGEHVAAELKECAQQEAALHAQLRQGNERADREPRSASSASATGSTNPRASSSSSPAASSSTPSPAAAELGAEEREALRARLERLARRREQLGPVNPLAQTEYEEALAHVEELERQRDDLETALRELNKLIADTDRQIRESFEQTFEAAARNFEQVAARLFPGGRGRLRLVTERDGGPARVLGGGPAPDDGKPEGDDGDDGDEARRSPKSTRRRTCSASRSRSPRPARR